MKLYKVQEAVTWVDPFGDRHSNLTKYGRIVEVVDVAPNGDFKYFHGSGVTFNAFVYGCADTRTWVEIVHRSYPLGGMTFYKPLFTELKPPNVGEHEVGPRYVWLVEYQLKGQRLVNHEGRAVDREGNLL